MNKFAAFLWTLLVMALSLLTACGGSSAAAPPLNGKTLGGSSRDPNSLTLPLELHSMTLAHAV